MFFSKNNVLRWTAPVLALFSALVVSVEAAEKTEVSKPKIEGESILCGNKRLDLTKDGKIRISSSGKPIGEIYCFFAVTNTKTGETDWNSFSIQESTLKREGNKFLWSLGKKTPEASWKAADQTLEITPEGLLKYSIKIHKPASPDWQRNNPGGYVWVVLPFDPADGSQILYNGTRHDLNSRTKPFGDYRSKEFVYQLYSNDPAKQFILRAVRGKEGADTTSVTPYPNNRHFRLTLQFSKETSSGSFLIDLRNAPALQTSEHLRGGIDFMAVEAIELPDASHKNLFSNASFEQGLEGWRVKHGNRDGQWNWIPFALDAKESFSGRHSLAMDARPLADADHRRLKYGVNLTGSVAVIPPGRYTVSLFAKCETASRADLNAWVPNFHTGSLYAEFSKEAVGRFALTPEWKRFSFSFDVPKAMPLELHLNVWTRSGKDTKVWIDALQLERGGAATAFEPRPAEGWLKTSDPDNFVSADRKINGVMEVSTAKKNVAGTMNLRVKNFFGEVLLTKSFDFRTGADGTAKINLPLDSLPGLGVFLVRADYSLNDGTKAYEFHRYSKVRYADGKRKHRNLFSVDYGTPEEQYDYPRILDRWRKIGIGMKPHHHTYRKEVWDLERSCGITPSHAFMTSYLRNDGRNLVGFGLLDSEEALWGVSPDDKRLLIRDFHLDAKGKITPEYLLKFKNAVRTIAAKHPHIPMWCLGGEFLAKFPPEWWTPDGSREECARIHATLLKAFAEGVREGNPRAEIFQDDPCNMRPEGGIAETDLLLQECNKLGVRFDRIAIHPYRFSPESPDLDADTQALFKMLDARGYGNVPVLWPEMMHWGPFQIPQWGVDSSTWGGVPRTWPGSLLSYDMGKTEKKSAAWFARSWLVALKYADRIVTATAGNTHNNFAMDVMLTPYAAQLVPNTLSNLLGDTVFREDIRFAPFLRAYVFEDAQKRPVAAVWCHLDKVDDGRSAPPVAEADFGSSLEGVFDLMNSPRKFNAGKFRFSVSAYPLFLRGKPGTLDRMTAALRKAMVVSGEGISPLEVTANPRSKTEARITFRNFLSGEFSGSVGGRKITIPGAGNTELILPLSAPLRTDAVTKEPLKFTFRSNSGAEYEYDLPFEAFLVKRLPDGAGFETLDWRMLSSIPFTRNCRGKETSGEFRLGWNRSGLFLEVTVKDGTFLHTEYPRMAERWNNDCLQIYFDTMADARSKRHGYDENDYDYALFPNAEGSAATVFRYRSVEPQLGLATQAPPDNAPAPDIPCSFSNRNGILTYRVFFPAKYLLPIPLKAGSAFGFGLYAANSDTPGKVTGALTLAVDGGGCFNRPHVWPAAVLEK